MRQCEAVGGAEKQLDELQSVMQFCSEYACRRKRLLLYFQEEVSVMTWSDGQKKKNDPRHCCDYCRVSLSPLTDL